MRFDELFEQRSLVASKLKDCMRDKRNVLDYKKLNAIIYDGSTHTHVIEHSHDHTHVINEGKHGHTHSVEELEIALGHFSVK